MDGIREAGNRVASLSNIILFVLRKDPPRVKMSPEHFVEPLVSFQISEEKVKSAEV